MNDCLRRCPCFSSHGDDRPLEIVMDSNVNGDLPLYNRSVLKGVEEDFEVKKRVTFNPPISPKNPGESLVLRPLELSDFDKGFLQLLQQLTAVGDVSREEFNARFRSMKESPDTYYVTVIEDTSTGQVVATATLEVEQKFIHQCSLRGRIEDVVVNDLYRGKSLGKLLLETLTLLSRELGCYKISLECEERNVPFYQKFGYLKDPQSFMQNRFKLENQQKL